jgi:uncharacterized protein (TIGR03382 family)
MRHATLVGLVLLVALGNVARADDCDDTDGDGLTDDQETELGTDPEDWDTDGDTYSDAEEVRDGTNPLDANDPGDPDDCDTGEEPDVDTDHEADTGELADSGIGEATGFPDADPGRVLGGACRCDGVAGVAGWLPMAALAAVGLLRRRKAC